MLSITDLVTDYGDPRGEAVHCRQHSALFDFSFVYRARVCGAEAIRNLEAFQPRRVRDMAIGQIRYSVRTDAQGRVRSDLTLWRFGEDVFEVMSGCAADIVELGARQGRDFRVNDLSETSAILALQGPETLARLATFADVTALRRLPYFHFGQIEVGGLTCLVGRLGYSGEAGFELILEQSHKDRLWQMLSARFRPAGFAAIDILRIEAGFVLFTNECRISPSIADLGLSALMQDAATVPTMKLVAFAGDFNGKSDPIIWQPGSSRIGRPGPGEIAVTSACFSPLFNRVMGLGFIACDHETATLIDPRREFDNIKLCSLPPYDPDKTRPRRTWRVDPR